MPISVIDRDDDREVVDNQPREGLDSRKLGGSFSVVSSQPDADGAVDTRPTRSIRDATTPNLVQEMRRKNRAMKDAQGLPQRTSAFSRRTALQNAGRGFEPDAIKAANQAALRGQYGAEDNAYAKGLSDSRVSTAQQRLQEQKGESAQALQAQRGAQAAELQETRGAQAAELQKQRDLAASQRLGTQGQQTAALQKQREGAASALQEAGFENTRQNLELAQGLQREQGRREGALPLLRELTGDDERAGLIAAALPDEVFEQSGEEFVKSLYEASTRGEKAQIEPEGLAENLRAALLGPREAPASAQQYADTAERPNFLRRGIRSVLGGLTGVGEPGERLATGAEGEEYIFPSLTRQQKLAKRLFGVE